MLVHSASTEWLEDGYDIRTVQEAPGHNDAVMTKIYVRVLLNFSMQKPGGSRTPRWTRESALDEFPPRGAPPGLAAEAHRSRWRRTNSRGVTTSIP